MLQNPPGITNRTTTMVLTQSSSTVTGAVSTIAAFVVSDTGSISGTMVGTSFTFRWVDVANYGGSATCDVLTTFVDGTLIVADNSMTGNMSSTPQPPCATRGSSGSYTWIRQP